MISYSKILPLLIIVAMISFSVRLTEVITGMSNLSASAYAKDAAQEQEPVAEAQKSNENSAAPEQIEGEDAQSPKWRDASDSNLDVEGIKLEMFEDLSNRRDRLEKLEKALQIREALLSAAEKELDRKISELDTLRNEIKGLLEEQGGQEAERIDSLVKIYEGMKPKDAARIFDTLDIDVLVRVMAKMSERKVAPVLAAMNAERARTVTIMLAEEKTLPVIE